MSVQSWLKKIVFPSALRNRKRRRGFQPVIPAGQILEQRQLLAATNILPIQDIVLTAEAPNASLELSQHFDDPEITGSTVLTETPLGNFIFETYDSITPITAQNFVDLAAGGNYADMFIHRIDPTDPLAIIQGGGFNYSETATSPSSVPNNGTIVNEFDNWFAPNAGGLAAGTPLNVRGTVAMAKVANNPDSATSQWFVNLSDNAAILDPQNGGFTVFAHVLYDGMDVVDAIAGLQITNAGSPFGELPLRSEVQQGVISRENLVTTTTSVVDELTFVSSNSNPSVVSATLVDGQLQVAAIDGQVGVASITVSATDLQGNLISDTFRVAVGMPLSTTLTSPVGGGQAARPEFSWDAIENATRYELWVNQVGGQNAIIREQTLTGTTFTPASDLPFGEYVAWVRVHDDSGSSNWSAAQAFSVDLAATEITSPDPKTSNTLPTIEWSAVEGATSYDVWVNHLGVQNQLIRQTVSGTSLTPSTELEEGSYRVWVQAKTDTASAEWSAGLTFRVTTEVTITAPAETSDVARPEIQWTGESTDTFELWVNAVGGQSKVIHETAVSGTTFTPTADLTDGLYRAWVRKLPAGGTPGAWSEAHDFAVAVAGLPAKPAITDVSGGTQLPRFSWAAVENGATFELWVNNLTTNTSRVIHEVGLTELNFTATENLAVGNYRVWLRAFTSAGSAGQWSDGFDFSI